MKSKDAVEKIDFEDFIKSKKYDSVTGAVLKKIKMTNKAFPAPKEISAYDDQPKESLSSIVEFRYNNLKSQGRILHGADICLKALKASSSEAHRSWIPLDTGEYLLIFIVNCESYEIDGCMSLKADKPTSYK
ncbi:hypothetical protein V2K52_20695 [Pseudomonas alliivorans]|nr:hypothetical protein [Pseudomonas alliivorans]MEE4794894.1 hypothetical protein [Pseudomonas alliivorans]MEE4799881.1 hypothetical protein [Pseudomonas alliivorans]MEE4810022.1 hypothetical protein [Pseudomonas alliivorans]MEE4824910.1 hypothetical protein [Pseudomonas alliivorans]